MEQERALLEAIRAQPDDAPRLVYADYLQEQGDPRGEFIQAQVRWHQAFLARDVAAMKQQGAREWPLRRQHEAAWRAPLEQFGLYGFEFRRGFMESAIITAADFLKNSGPIFQLAPLLRELFFDQRGAEAVRLLAEYPPLARLESIRFGEWSIPAPALSAFAASPYAANLRSLSLGGSRVTGPTAMAACVQLLGLPRLARLSIDHTPLGDEGVEALAQSPDFSRLRVLSARHTGITDAGVAVLAGSPHLACSEGLDLGANDIADGSAQALADSPRSACLTTLGLRQTGVGNAGLGALIRSPHLTSLHSLSIASRITNPGMVVLAASPTSSQLRDLDLSSNYQLGVAGAEALAASEHLTNLESLNLEDTKIGRRGALALIHSPNFPALRWLHVGTESGRPDRVLREALAKRFGA